MLVLVPALGARATLQRFHERMREKPGIQRVEASHSLPPEAAVAVLLDFLSDPDEEVWMAAAGVLAMKHREACRGPVGRMLRSDDWAAVDRALEVVSASRDDWHSEAVLSVAMATADQRRAVSAAVALGDIGAWKGLETLRNGHPIEGVREVAGRLLKRRGNEAGRSPPPVIRTALPSGTARPTAASP